jgi:hypothetical protein
MSTHPQRPQHNALGILATPRARTFPPGLRSTQPIPLVLSPSIQLSISRPDPGSSSGSPSSQGGSDGVLLYLPPTRFRRLRCVRTESARVWVWDLRVGPRTRSGARTTASPSCHHERPSGQGKGEEAGREVRTCNGQGRSMTLVVNRLARRSLVLPVQVQCHIATSNGHLPASTYTQTCQAEPRLGGKITAILATNLDLPPDPPVLTRMKLRCTSHFFFISISFFGQARMHRTGPVEPSVRGI